MGLITKRDKNLKYGLKTLLVIVLLFAMTCFFLSSWLDAGKQHTASLKALKSICSAHVNYDFEVARLSDGMLCSAGHKTVGRLALPPSERGLPIRYTSQKLGPGYIYRVATISIFFRQKVPSEKTIKTCYDHIRVLNPRQLTLPNDIDLRVAARWQEQLNETTIFLRQGNGERDKLLLSVLNNTQK